jgi:methylthioribose-1-phosphate isomerase
MKTVLLAILLISACAAGPIAPRSLQITTGEPLLRIPPTEIAPELADAETIAALYHAIEPMMVRAVTAQAATPVYIQAVINADDSARRKLLVMQNRKHLPARSAIKAARDAVYNLAEVLDEQPGEVTTQ